MSRELLTTCFECGAQIVFGENEEIVTCEYCYMKNARPKSTGEELAAMKRGNELRANCEFEEALQCYEYVLRKFPDEHEALWGKLLCKYGVETVEEKRYGKTARYQLCHRVRKTALRNEGDYRRACELAPAEVRAQYEEIAAYVDNVQSKVREKVAGKEGYEVFICYKETDPVTGGKTLESSLARQMANRYQKAGYKVFFAPYALDKVYGEAYEAEIYHAITTAKVMIVFGLKPEHFRATWPKSEWMRFLEIMEEGDKLLISVYGGMRAEDLPEEFLNMGLHGCSIDTDPNYMDNIEHVLYERIRRPKQDTSRKSKASLIKVLSAILVIAVAAGGGWLASSRNRETTPRETFVMQETTETPTVELTVEPTATPTEEPTATPMVEPMAEPTATPTVEPTATPTAEPMPVPTATPTPSMVDANSPKESIQNLQQMLIEVGILPLGSDDGVYGKNTTKAVRHFQALINQQIGEKTLTVNGIADGQTMMCLEFAADTSVVALTASANGSAIMPETHQNKRRIVDVGSAHIVGLKADGTVVAVGNRTYGKCDIDEWNNIVAVAAGYDHTVGLKADGTVAAVGSNEYGQCNIDEWNDIVTVTAGYYHTIGQRADGTVVAVGDNEYGQCNTDGWSDIVAVAGSPYHTVGIKADGTVVAVGKTEQGQCNVGEWKNIVAIAVGTNHTVGLKADGTVVAVGQNADGQCNTRGWKDIVAVAAGSLHTVGLKADGTVVAAGWNKYGQCDTEGWTDVVAIDAYAPSTVGLRADGTVVAAGGNGDGQCDTSGWSDIIAVFADPNEPVGLKVDGTVVVGGHHSNLFNASDWDLF